MELRHLRYFLAVAEELHFGRAAKKLRISQPPLSAQIQSLEHELGVQLFTRSTRRVALTAAGTNLRDRTRTVLSDLDRAIEETKDIGAGASGVVRVGFISSASYTAIPRAVSLFRRRHPKVRLELDPLTSGEQLDALAAGRLDVGLIRGAVDATHGLRALHLFSENLVALVPATYELAASDVVSPVQLARENMILFPQRLMPGFVAQVLGIFKDLDTLPREIQQAVHQETVVNLVAAGVGVAVLPESVSKFCPEEVRVLPISNLPTTSLLAVLPESAPPSPGAEHFLDCLVDSTRDT